MSAEYIMAEGNPNVILCERGIRTFETSMRNTLDISAVPMLQKDDPPARRHRPEPRGGHRAGWCPQLAQAAVAVGADGLMIESPQRPGQGQERRCPEPDPRPVRRP